MLTGIRKKSTALSICVLFNLCSFALFLSLPLQELQNIALFPTEIMKANPLPKQNHGLVFPKPKHNHEVFLCTLLTGQKS